MVYVENKLICCGRSKLVWHAMKTRQGSDVSNHIGLVYVESDNELSGPIWLSQWRKPDRTRRYQSNRCGLGQKQNWVVMTNWSGEVCDENKTRQWRNWTDRCDLHWKWYWTIVKMCVVSDENYKKNMTWSIIQVRSMSKTKLSCHDRSDRVSSVTKTKQVNNMIDCTSAVYAKNDTELLRQIGSVVDYDKNQIGKQRD